MKLALFLKSFRGFLWFFGRNFCYVEEMGGGVGDFESRVSLFVG